MRTPLQKGEKILLVTYSSWTILIVPVLIAVAGITAAFFIGFIERYGWIAAIAGIVYAWSRYIVWKVNVWVVTNYRVIDESGLLSHYAKESPLDKINNVSYDQTVMGRLFNFGHVEIQTAAEVGATDYYNVNHPKRLKDTITAAQSEYKDLQLNNQAAQLAAAFSRQQNEAGPGNDRPAGYGGGGASLPQGHGIAGELEKLFDLHQKGALSPEEYERAKKRLLGH
jgi:membrane protein YdbS with pleckstrin-like domain